MLCLTEALLCGRCEDRRSKMQEDFLRLRALLLDLFRARHFLVEINDSTDVGQQ